MTLTPQVKDIFDQLNINGPKVNIKGKIRVFAKDIKKNHDLAMELWNTQKYFLRMLAILIMDTKVLDREFVEKLAKDIQQEEHRQYNELADCLVANQIQKNTKLIDLMEMWQNHELSILRRLYWYYQTRKRWTGKIPIDQNTAEMLKILKETIAAEQPEVQQTMNFILAQIGIFEKQYHQECIDFGKKLGLYKDEKVSRGCTPNYLPEFIRIEAGKREG